MSDVSTTMYDMTTQRFSHNRPATNNKIARIVAAALCKPGALIAIWIGCIIASAFAGLPLVSISLLLGGMMITVLVGILLTMAAKPLRPLSDMSQFARRLSQYLRFAGGTFLLVISALVGGSLESRIGQLSHDQDAAAQFDSYIWITIIGPGLLIGSVAIMTLLGIDLARFRDSGRRAAASQLLRKTGFRASNQDDYIPRLAATITNPWWSVPTYYLAVPVILALAVGLGAL